MVLGGSQRDIEVLTLGAISPIVPSEVPREAQTSFERAVQLGSRPSLPNDGATDLLKSQSIQPTAPARCRAASDVAEHFCVRRARCSHAIDRERLLGAIEAAFGDTEPFDGAVRELLSSKSSAVRRFTSSISAEHNSGVALWRRARRLLSGYARATAARVAGSLGRSTAESRVERSAGMC